MVGGTVYKSYVRPTILFGSEVWCLIENDMEILPRTEVAVRTMCGAQLIFRKSK